LSIVPSDSLLIERATEFARAAMAHDATGHDWWHTWRVRGLALQIAAAEGADPLVVELGSLLHDVDDWKLRGGDHEVGPRVAAERLVDWGADQALADRVARIIAEVTYRGAEVVTPATSIEGGCVQDADRLDAIGAIGVARAFAYGGAKGRALYDPAVPPVLHGSFAAYKSSAGPTLNHFDEKLVLLRDRMQTAMGRQLAEQRHQFLIEFQRQFLAEWQAATDRS
jgi:uncharacterized protein